MNITDTASGAIMQQSRRLQESANRITAAGDINNKANDVDLAREAVVQIEAEHLTKANIAVIKTEDERTKSLLDLFA